MTVEIIYIEIHAFNVLNLNVIIIDTMYIEIDAFETLNPDAMAIEIIYIYTGQKKVSFA